MTNTFMRIKRNDAYKRELAQSLVPGGQNVALTCARPHPKGLILSYDQDWSPCDPHLRAEEMEGQRDFPGGPEAKTPHSQRRGPGLDLWSGNSIPRAATKDLACCNQILWPNEQNKL